MPKRSDYLTWTEYFIAIAQLCALRSKDPNTQVGAVVVNQNKEIIATGYNGLPRGCNDDNYPWENNDENWLKTKYPYVVHAEANAIIHARQNCAEFSLYTTLFPCCECAKLIIQAGIKQIFYASDKHKEQEQTIAAKIMLNDAKVKFSLILVPKVIVKKT
ncbi:MAG: deoxycytidylate deaminase [Mycoplasmataceae bacterium RC_NB112A]|nr:MAG: deoxycytidylate deaminase [Mycoplasmataceae bacterium RC_NB112A]